jgi:hypothetical protein
MRFAMVVGMPDENRDPSGNTEQFKAFVARQESPAASPAAARRLPLLIAAVVAAVAVIALIAWLVA